MQTADQLLAAAAAVDLLNRHARGPDPRLYRPRAITYWLKDRALRGLDDMPGLATHERLCIEALCTDCAGTGRSYDDHGGRRAHCRKCGSTGTVDLRFIVTTIADGRWTWHSPARPERCETFADRKWAAMLGTEVIRQAADEPGAWSPRQVGQDYPAAEVAEALCIAEDLLGAVQQMQRLQHLAGLFAYTLDLGITGAADTCALCGEAEEVTTCLCRRERLYWHPRLCAVCGRTLTWQSVNKSDGIIKRPQSAGPPTELLEDARIQRWIASHPVPPAYAELYGHWEVTHVER